MNTRDICDVCGGIGEACVCLCDPASSSLQQHGLVRTCEMERISREGKCGKPASGFWIHDDETKTAVCDMCALSVTVNGGKLEEAPNNDSNLRTAIQDRIKQHRDNLELWQSGALRPTVEDDDEQRAVMHDLEVAIYELETVLRQAQPSVVLDT